MRRSNSCDTSPVFLGLVYVSHNASGGRSSGEGIFYESTGMRGQSSVREVDVATGKVLKKVPQSAPVFSEGLALINDRLFQLAWQVKTGTIYNRKSLQKIGSFRHQMTDGWGLSTYNKSLLVGSDGTSYIYFISATTFKTLHKVKVTDGGTPIAWINELEVRGGRIYANVWQTDCIAVIDPLSGRVAAWMDLQRLRALAAAQVKPNQEFDVLNGIAWDAQQRRLFVTGKYWPRVFQIAPKTLTRSTADDVAAIRLSHVVVLKSFAMKPMPGVRLTLVTRDVHTPYSGMLPGLVAGHYTYDDCHIDLRPLAQLTNARLLHCCASGIDLDQRAVVLADGRPPIRYDVLSIDIGITPLQSVPGAKELTLPVKPIDSFTHRWEALRSRILSLAPGSSVRVVVVGGGAGGVELLLAMQHRLQQDCLVLDAAVVAVRQRGVESGGEGGDREGAVDGAEGEVGRGSSSGAGGGEKRESAVQGGVLVLEGGEEVEFDECVWCTQVGVLVCVSEQEGLALDSNGFIRVGDTLESISHRGVFAAGDIHSSIAHIPPPPACPISCQTPPTSYVTPLLPREEQPPGLAKRDRIDRAFMQQFNQLPAMPSPPLPTIPVAHTAGPEALLALKSMPMRCGGCGSKVGSSLLSRVLTRLAALPSRPPGHPEILLGLDSPDDAAVLAIPPEGKGGCQSPVLVQTVDFFRSFLSDPHTFGRIAALHALSDCFAMGADPVSALAIVTLPYGTEEKMEEELFQVMAGAIRELDAATCQLVGGHTVEGAELSLGFAVTGLADRDRLLRKAGMHEGDAIILTKPIGTGVIFAANMRCKAKGRWVDGAIDSMLVSNQKAASIALQHGALAATDVTGFGLLGHLVEMTTASRVTVTIDPSTIPIMDGARQCVEDGIFSSLQDSNLRLRRAITNYEEASAHLLTLLLFDPQTAGGLLFSFHP
ncbi:unnamed protein product [Closterium sp. Naga37s-1]|nr:unnamed protein product [Closterium sp. Naga37s-1]